MRNFCYNKGERFLPSLWEILNNHAVEMLFSAAFQINCMGNCLAEGSIL